MPVWRILTQISEDCYILSQAQGTYVRYAPLYIHSFRLGTPYKLTEAQQFIRQNYEDITNVPDKLRWLRYSRGLLQTEVAQEIGVTENVYKTMEEGIKQSISGELAEKLAGFYDVPAADFLNGYDAFLYDGQAQRIQAYRKKLGMGRKAFAQCTGIPLTSLRYWENGQKVISRKCWERYFKGKA